MTEARDKSGVRVRVAAVTGHKSACITQKQVFFFFLTLHLCHISKAAEGAGCVSPPTACICICIHTYTGSLKQKQQVYIFVCECQHAHLLYDW